MYGDLSFIEIGAILFSLKFFVKNLLFKSQKHEIYLNEKKSVNSYAYVSEHSTSFGTKNLIWPLFRADNYNPGGEGAVSGKLPNIL